VKDLPISGIYRVTSFRAILRDPRDRDVRAPYRA
jgi:hypothetical protein